MADQKKTVDQKPFDPARWKREIDASKIDSPEELDALIEWRLQVYGQKRWRDWQLWNNFQEDFATFTKETFKVAAPGVIRDLRDFLRANGVFVQMGRGLKIAHELFKVLQEENPTAWTEEDIQKQMDTIDGFNSHQNPASSTAKRPAPLTPPAPPLPVQPKPTVPMDPPEQIRSNSAGFQIAQLAKFYTNDDMKYSGTNDNLDRKLTMFHDICDRIDLPPDARARAFPTILRGLALDRYYSTCTNRGYSLDNICHIMRQHFEGPEHKRNLTSKWDSLTLKTVISRNQGKSTEDCLQLLIEELTHLQHGFDTEYKTEKHLLNKLISACQDVPACEYACCKPSETLSGFINDLQSSIRVHDKKTAATVLFTDRRYH